MAAINKKGVVDYPYIAGYMDKKIELYAPSIAAAKQIAVEYFHPTKRNKGYLWVELAEEE